MTESLAEQRRARTRRSGQHRRSRAARIDVGDPSRSPIVLDPNVAATIVMRPGRVVQRARQSLEGEWR